MEDIQGRAASESAPLGSLRRPKTIGGRADVAVHVVDDEESIRYLIRTLVEADGISVFSYASGEEFLQSFQPESSGCLVLDLQLPGISGLEVQEILIKRGVRIPIIFFTAQGSISKAVTALKNGAVDFVEKPFDYKDLLNRIRKYIKIDADNRQHRDAAVAAAFRFASLTPREREVMDQIIAGQLNKQIADELSICVKTVEFHRARVMEKMGVHSVAELVQMTLGFSLVSSRASPTL